MCSKEYYNFERQLAFHTAPSLLGIKCASLMSFNKGNLDLSVSTDEFNRRAIVRGLTIRTLCECSKRVLMLVYNEKKLAARLSDAECRMVLRENGYTDDMDMEECLLLLAERVQQSGDFPHEIGIFLDYPVEDVIGFIRNNGCRYKLSGYWKVYGDPERAQRTFDNYNKCRRFLFNKLDEGQDLCTALRIS